MTFFYRLIFFFLAFASFSLFSQENAFLAPLANKSLLLDIDSTDFSVVVGERGIVLINQDTEGFVQVVTPTQSTLTAVTTIGNDIWAVGHDAVIIHSSNRGESWQIQNYAPALERPFLDVLFFDSKHGIAVGAYGLFFRTINGGITWSNEPHTELLDPLDQEYLKELKQENEDFYNQELNSILPHINRISRRGKTLLLAGESGLLASSDNEGRTWTRLDTNYFGSFFDVLLIQSDKPEYVVVGLRGNSFYSSDGVSWDKIQTCTSSTLNSIFQIDKNTLLAVGNNGTKVKMTLPLSSALNKSANQCDSLINIQESQTADKNAILSAAKVGKDVVAVTAAGLATLTIR